MKGLLLGSTAALLALTAPGHAAVAPDPSPAAAPRIASYADLLAPIPQAAAQLEADDAARARQPKPVQLAQYHHHHHHHHHHHFPFGLFFGPRPFPVPVGVPFPRPVPVGVAPAPVVAPPYCYWAPGPAFWNGFRWVRRPVRVCP